MLRIFQSDRFRQAYVQSGVGLQGLVEHAIRDLRRRHPANPLTVLQQYPRHAHLSDVLEIAMAGRHRLLASYHSSKLVLLDLGPHNIVVRYTRALYANALLSTRTSPSKPGFAGRPQASAQAASFVYRPRVRGLG